MNNDLLDGALLVNRYQYPTVMWQTFVIKSTVFAKTSGWS